MLGGRSHFFTVAVGSAVTEADAFGLPARAPESTPASAMIALAEAPGAALAEEDADGAALAVTEVEAVALGAALVVAIVVVVGALLVDVAGAPLPGGVSHPSAATPVESAKSAARERPGGAMKLDSSSNRSQSQNGQRASPRRTCLRHAEQVT